MTLSLSFGLHSAPIIMTWNKAITDFPKVINYAYRNWEWIMYEVSKTAFVEYDLVFGELKIYDPRALEIHPTLASLSDGSEDICDCGADKHPKSGGHWKFCKIYGKP